MKTIDYISIIISISAMIVSMIALIYTIKTYLLKYGANIKGQYSICSNIACEDKYFSSLVLENQKDRAIVIFKIYIKLGYSYFVEVDDFENEPLILKPFEVFKKEYDPIDFYSVSTNRINIDNLLNNDKVKKKIVLSTSNGKYIVKENIKCWNPIIHFFKNHMTAIIYPMRCTYKGKAYGINAKYIIVFKYDDTNEEIVPIYKNDYKIKKFKNFSLTRESLRSKDALEEFIYSQAINGLLNCNDILVYEIESWRNELYKIEGKNIVQASYYNGFQYNIYGKIITIYEEYRLKKSNRKIRKNMKM